jgi:hypothetical protein
MLIKKYIFLRRKKKIRIFHPVRILQTHNDHNKMETSSLLLSRLDMIIFLSFVILLPPIFWRIRVCVCVCVPPPAHHILYIYIHKCSIFWLYKEFLKCLFLFFKSFLGFLFLFGFDLFFCFSASSNFLSIH